MVKEASKRQSSCCSDADVDQELKLAACSTEGKELRDLLRKVTTERRPLHWAVNEAIHRDPCKCEPSRPPFRPPQRIKTPPGLPRWPGERDLEPDPQSTSRGMAFIQRLRSLARNPLRLGAVSSVSSRTAPDRPSRTGRRFWRPPASGHGSPGYEWLDRHPYATAVSSSEDLSSAFHDTINGVEVRDLYGNAQGALNAVSETPAPGTLPVERAVPQAYPIMQEDVLEPSTSRVQSPESPSVGTFAARGRSIRQSDTMDTPDPVPTSAELATQQTSRLAQDNAATSAESNDREPLPLSTIAILPLGPRTWASSGWQLTPDTCRKNNKIFPWPIPARERIADQLPNRGRHPERIAPFPPVIESSSNSSQVTFAPRYTVFPQPRPEPQHLLINVSSSRARLHPLQAPYRPTSPSLLPPPNLDGTNDPSHSSRPRRRLTSHSAKLDQAHPNCWKCRCLAVLESGMRRLGHSCICGYRAEVVPGESHELQTLPNARHVASASTSQQADDELEHARRTAPGARGRGHWTFRSSVAVPKGEALRVGRERSRERRERERETWEWGNEEALRHVGGVGVHDAPVSMGSGGAGSKLGLGRSDSVMGHGGLQSVEAATITKPNGELVPVLVGGKGSEKHEVVEPVAVATRPVELGRGTTQLGTITAPSGEAVPVKVRHRSSEHEVVVPVIPAARPVELGRGTTQLGTVTAATGEVVPVKVRHPSSEHEVIEPVSVATRPVELGRGTTQLGTVTGAADEVVPVKVRHRSSEHEQVSRLGS